MQPACKRTWRKIGHWISCTSNSKPTASQTHTGDKATVLPANPPKATNLKGKTWKKLSMPFNASRILMCLPPGAKAPANSMTRKNHLLINLWSSQMNSLGNPLNMNRWSHSLKFDLELLLLLGCKLVRIDAGQFCLKRLKVLTRRTVSANHFRWLGKSSWRGEPRIYLFLIIFMLFIWSSCKDPEWLSSHVFIIHWLGLLGLLKPRLTVLVMMTAIDY